jgi:hypothetical protein
MGVIGLMGLMGEKSEKSMCDRVGLAWIFGVEVGFLRITTLDAGRE